VGVAHETTRTDPLLKNGASSLMKCLAQRYC